MKVRKPIDQENTHLRSEEKQSNLVSWLSEWCFSTLELSSAYLGVRYDDNRKFFNKMRNLKIIEEFESKCDLKRRLVTLGFQGLKMVDPERRKALAKRKHCASNGRLSHDLEVQRVALSFLPNIEDLTCDRNLPRTMKIPDMLLTTKELKKQAVEVELSIKSSIRIFHIFAGYLSELDRNTYDYVSFVFRDQDTSERYQMLFNRLIWPKIELNPARKLVYTSQKITIPSDDPRRELVNFQHLPMNPPRLLK